MRHSHFNRTRAIFAGVKVSRGGAVNFAVLHNCIITAFTLRPRGIASRRTRKVEVDRSKIYVVTGSRKKRRTSARALCAASARRTNSKRFTYIDS